MSIDDAVEILGKNNDVAEFYVLLREIQLYLNIDDCFPRIKIKIFKSNVVQSHYYFVTSHYAQTPVQAGPYITSTPWADTEELAIERAISNITSYLKNAIKEGHEPSEDWLVVNENF